MFENALDAVGFRVTYHDTEHKPCLSVFEQDNKSLYHLNRRGCYVNDPHCDLIADHSKQKENFPTGFIEVSYYGCIIIYGLCVGNMTLLVSVWQRV